MTARPLVIVDTLLCSCEEITLGEVCAALDQGARDPQAGAGQNLLTSY